MRSMQVKTVLLLTNPAGGVTPLVSLRSKVSLSWNLDEVSDGSGAVPRAASIGGMTLTDTNTCASADGVSIGTGNSVLFVRANSERLQRDSEAALQVGDTTYSITMWGYFESKPGNMYLAAKGQDGASREWVILYESGTDTIRFAVYNNTTLVGIVNSAVVPLQTWFHIAVGHDHVANEVWISLNAGTPVVAATTGASAVNAVRLYLGSAADVYLDGRLDQFNIFKGSRLSQAEIAADYNGGNGIKLIP
jgi:hypothetical protein